MDVSLIEAPTPVSRFQPEPDSTGAWITVVDPQGREVFHRLIPDAGLGGEIKNDDGSMRRLKSRRGPSLASLEAPWPGEGSRIVVHARAAKPRRAIRGEAPTSEIGRLDMAPVPSTRWLFGKSKPSFPVTVDPGWGRDNPNALNLVFMPDAFLAGRMQGFHDQVEAVKALLEQTPPFDGLTAALRICRIEIPSETGVVGAKAGRTYFKARFSSGEVARVIEIDQTLAAKVLQAHFPGRSARGLVVANTTTYGGAGGAVAVFSCHPTWSAHIALHELCHSEFDLADEYVAEGPSTPGNPGQPNVSGDFRRERLKWAHLVAAATPLPTWTTGQPPPSTAAVGAFQGSAYSDKLWRPEFDCKMRHVETPGFCAVCRAAIVARLKPLAP